MLHDNSDMKVVSVDLESGKVILDSDRCQTLPKFISALENSGFVVAPRVSIVLKTHSEKYVKRKPQTEHEGR